MDAGVGRDAGTSIAQWAREALAQISALPGVRRVGLALSEGGGRRLTFTASDRAHDAEVEWCHVDAYDDVPLNTAVRSTRPVIGALADLDERFAEFVERQRGTSTEAIAAVPIVAAGQTLGGFVVFFDEEQAFDRTQRQELTDIGADLGAGLRSAQRGRERPATALVHEPVARGAATASHEVAPEAAAVGPARRFLRTTLRDWGLDEDLNDRAVLCLSELVTNAVVHAHSGCVVRVLLDRGVLTTTVMDNGTAEAPTTESSDDPLRVHGHGLQLIEALATRWGSELDTMGTTVWFVLET
ncbi:ATP-binding protein [Nocardioides sp.]|uniref:ATP-binding protein n=1 Tax=Nocardioides sp. TaxID=35761 RepID=UPI002736510B|nr:ATP-binding protein [Nocardioides sp.]MDP3891721.1 ATP-binding protein [Nocardioides sp.]